MGPSRAGVASAGHCVCCTCPIWQDVIGELRVEVLEAQSIALAWQLQEEEQAAFVQAISANSPVATGRARTPANGAQQETQMETEEDDDEASLQLAMRLQQEELRWQQLQSRRTVAAAMRGQVYGHDRAKS